MTIDPRRPPPRSWVLTWADVDPSTHPFAADTVPAVVRAVAPAELPPPYDPRAPLDRHS